MNYTVPGTLLRLPHYFSVIKLSPFNRWNIEAVSVVTKEEGEEQIRGMA